MKLPKTVIEVDYIDSGSFQGSDEEAFLSGCSKTKELGCVAMTRKTYEKLAKEARMVKRLRVALHVAAVYIGDRSAGSAEFWDLYDDLIKE